MKKYLIKEAKKSLSLLLAVLMLMSCWVWVAPEKAEAANITPKDQYEVEVSWTVGNKATTGGNIQYKTLGDGWGSESGYNTALNSMSGKTATGTYTHTWTTTDFPTVVRVETTFGSGTSKSRTTVNYIKINGKTVYHGGEGWDGANSCEFYPNLSTDNFGTTGSTGQTYTWPRPMITGFIDSSATTNTPEINITLNKVGEGNVSGSTTYDIAKYECYDQYGVAIRDVATYVANNRFANVKSQTTYVSDSNNSDDPSKYADDIWSKSDSEQTVIASPELQVSNPQGSSGSDTFYLVRKYVMDDGMGGEQISKVSAKVNVTYPKYTVNFNAGLSQAKIPNGENTATGTYSPSGYNGGTITVPDNKSTSADGYTFYGYWSKQQPDSGNASYNAATADFAQPCSTEDYNAYTAMSDAKENNGIVTVTVDGVESRYYDAGVAMDPSTVKTIDVSENYKNFTGNWYGWWLSKDLSVKFYDVDGTFLGDELVKSGQPQSAITWPTSKYINSGYTSGAFKFKVDADIWENTDGTEINKTSYTFTKDLVLTPKITRESFEGEYAVTFINPNSGSSVAVGTNGSYAYRADIKNYADTAQDKIAATPSDVEGALDYSYELLGWSSVKPTTGKNYHILLEDADFDVNGTSIGLNSDWVVRNNATYYAVYRRHTKTYVVNFNYKDATGADATRQLKVKYGANLVPPTEYVPYTYVTKGFGYTFYKWTFTSNSGDATLDYSATIPFTSEYIEIAGAALEGTEDLEPIVITADYGDPVATPYTVTFNYVDDKGEEVSKPVEVRNEQFILQSTVSSLTPAEEWDHEDKLYTYAKKWEITEGSATVGINGEEKKAGDIIDTADLISLTPTSNITFKAVYANPVPFYTVTYVDGLNSVTYRVLQDTNVPAWTNKAINDNGTPDDKTDDFEGDKIYVPADYEGEGGTYVFQGWYDQKQTDSEYKQTNGNKITTADTVTGNLTLYSQFKFVPFKYTITFMNHDGTVQLGAGEFEKGQNIEALVTTATKAAQGRAADETYTYLFLGWDKAVPTFCEGYDVTYTAQYKPVYKYYDVKWYNSKLVDGKWVADKSTSEVDGKAVETYLLATTHHTYNSKLYTASVDNLDCPETAPAGQSYVFAGWYYNDAEGNAVKYERGMLVTAEMEFYATYTLTAKVHTVTAVVRGETETYSVADGGTVVIPDPQAGWKDATTHDAFAGWYTDADYTTEFDADAAITADITIYAYFTVSDHEYSVSEVESVPTYYAEGSMKKWCACDQEKTTTTVKIPKLTDTKIPTGTIYLGGLGQWSSTDDIGGTALDTNEDGTAKEITLYANADTDVIITANDTGDVDELYNTAGLGIGVKYVRAFAFPADTVLTSENYGAAQSLAADVYVDETTALTNNANFAIKLGKFVVADLDEEGNVQKDDEGNIKYKPLQSGEGYIIYYYVVDKAGNQLNRKVRTAKFIYDDTDPTFTVEGTSNEAAVPTYCGVATVTGLEKDVVLTVNGAAVTVTYADDATTGTYAINYAEGMDNVIITATDKAGNSFSKKIKVADHSWLVDEKASTCTEDGYKMEVCLICDAEKDKITYKATGHVMGQPEIIPADCVNNGYSVTKCVNCDYKVETEFAYDEEAGENVAVVPAHGHDFAKDENDEIIYETVTESTCSTAGIAEAYCTYCNGELEGGYITKTLDLDSENHEKITVSQQAADCITDGYYKETCVCGDVLVDKNATTDPDIYEAKGHKEGAWEIAYVADGEESVPCEATCYQPGKMRKLCTECSAIIVDATEYAYTEDADNAEIVYVLDEDGNKVVEGGKYKYYLLPATGEHVKTLSNPDTYKEDGVVKYHCATEGCPYEYEDKKLENEEIEEFTVKFYAEDGTTLIKEITKEKGTSIAKDAVTAPEKAATAEFKYSFAGWVEFTVGEDGKITEGATCKLPLEVTKNVALKASYKETAIKYTHQFLVPTTFTATAAAEEETKVYATLLGVIGEVRVPSNEPVFRLEDAAADAELKKQYTFKFEGWKSKRTGEIVTDFTIAGDAQFIAVFTATPVKYEVIFYNGTEYLKTMNVEAGKPAEYDGETPVKASDASKHYTFNGWYTDADCTTKYVGSVAEDGTVTGAITEKTRLYAGFTGTEHTYALDTTKGSVVNEEAPEVKDGILKAATCTENGKIAIKCTATGCKHTDETEYEIGDDGKLTETLIYPALGHERYKVDENGDYVLVDGEKVENIETVTTEDGVFKVLKCSRCGEVLDESEVSVTVTFKPENGAKDEVLKLDVNADIKYDVKPTKASDEKYTYTFLGWYLEGDENQTVVTDFGKADVNKTFVAKYDKKVRTYTVSYLNHKNEIIATAEIPYDTVISAVLTAPVAPEKPSTETLHFTFVKWSVAADTVVKGDIKITPEYANAEHVFEETGESAGATCTDAGGKVLKCSCGKTSTTGGTPALGHKFATVIDEKAATYEEAGYIIRKCTNAGCNETETKVIPKREYKTITVTVKNAEGALVEGAKVDLYCEGTWVAANVTNANGVVTFTVGDEDYTYTVLISGVEGLNQEIQVGAGENKEVSVEKTEPECSCSCHRAGFWGAVFRFFHNIIKFFTGRISCCSCPDSRY